MRLTGENRWIERVPFSEKMGVLGTALFSLMLFCVSFYTSDIRAMLLGVISLLYILYNMQRLQIEYDLLHRIKKLEKDDA